MKSRLFILLTILSVLFICPIATAQAPAPEHEEIILTTYYPAPYGDYAELTVSGNATSPALAVTPTLTATANNDTLTALHINPTFNDAGFANIQHNGLIVQDGNVGIGTASPQAKLDVTGDVRFAPTSQPISPQPGMIYYDQIAHVMRYYRGGASPGWVDIGGVSATTWTPVGIDLGALPYDTTTRNYNIPVAVPVTATEILVHAWFSHGDGGSGQNPAHYYVYTAEGTTQYTQLFQVSGGHAQNGWYDGQSLCSWFPLTSNRMLYVRRTQATGGRRMSGLYILGYR